MRIGLTMGDPTGIGPDLIVRALAAEGEDDAVVFGDPAVLARAARRWSLPLPREVVAIAGAPDAAPGSVESGAAQVAFLEAAIEAARRGAIDALVTAPIHKASCRRAGFPFPGHTELLAERLGLVPVAMMLAGPRLRVVPATTHLALSSVPRALTVDGLATVVRLTAEGLHDLFGVAAPRVAVCGLNPHAGEEGEFGDEERRVIAPAIAQARARLDRFPVVVSGPLPADTVFRQAAAPPHGDGRFDAVVAMYHDQALVPLKLLDFDEGVNLTLGLPLVRTSPDHGVAHDIVGTDRIRDTSFRAALRLARDLTRRRHG